MGDCFRRLSGGLDHGRRRREDDVNVHAHKFGRESRKLVNVIGPSKFNDDILALHPAEVAQAGP
jgi:hypothetical protein